MQYYFAPMEGITGYVFRNAHHRFYPGADRYFTPFLTPGSSHKLSSRDKKEILPEHNRGCLVVPQILTNHSEDFLWAVEELAEYGYKEVNLNLGCPSATVTAKYKGAGFLARREELDRFFEEIFDGMERLRLAVGISVKTRLGMEEPEEFPALLAIYNRYPLRELIIHPRIRSDFYSGRPRIQDFIKGAANCRRPVCYNGDIFSEEDYGRLLPLLLTIPQVGSVMAGRGALADPALFSRLRKVESRPYGESGESAGEDEAERVRMRAFLEELLTGYQEIMQGDRNVLFKMKELWFYLGCHFPEDEKQLKKIRKSQTVKKYREAVGELFETGYFAASSRFSSA